MSRLGPLRVCVAAFVLATIAACSLGKDLPAVDEVVLARDPDATQPTTTFAPDDTFYCAVTLTDGADETQLTARWVAADVDGYDADYFLGETTVTTKGGVAHFELRNDAPWPAGTYRVDVYLGEERVRSVEFAVR